MSNFIHNHRKATVLGSIGGLLLTAGIAWAIYLMTLGVSGSITGGQADVTFSGSPTLEGCAGSVAYTGSTIPKKAMTINLTSAFPGDVCTVKAQVAAYGLTSEDLKIQAYNIVVPTGWTFTPVTPVGTTIPKGTSMGNSGTPVPLEFTLKAPASGSTAGSISGTGIDVVPASQYTP